MGIATNIVRRGGSTFYDARIAVPKDRRDAYRRTELWISLRTSDLREARRLGADQIAKWQTEFSEKRRKRAPSEADLQDAAWNHYQSTIERDAQNRAFMPKPDDFDQARDKLLEDLRPGAVFMRGYVDRHPEIATSGLKPLGFYDPFGEPLGHAMSPIFDAAWHVTQDGCSP